MEHVMVPQRAAGHGRWLECTKCGTAKHSGYYWLGGFKSKEEPPCPESFNEPAYIDWREAAQDATGDILGYLKFSPKR